MPSGRGMKRAHQRKGGETKGSRPQEKRKKLTTMIKKLLFLILALCLTTGVNAQEEVTVKTFKELMSDLSARTSRRYDLNDEPCALVKVQYPKEGATFEGTIVGDVEYKNGEYWVYLSKGTKRLRLHLPNVPTIVVEFSDYGIDQAQSNTTYSINFRFPGKGIETSFYVEGGFVAGGMMGAEVSLGMYLGGFNIELDAMLPMAGEQSVFWQSADKMPEEFSYKPSLCFGARLGYGIMAGSKFRITPQVGVLYMGLTETAKGNTSLAPAKGANCASLTAGCKLQYMVAKNFGISITPQYNAALAKSKGFQALADASSDISKWNNGVGVKLALNVEF